MIDKGALDKILELCRLPVEQEWFEFKVDQAEPQEIGEYISALSNTATIHGLEEAYLVWGVRNIGHEIVGTNFDPYQTKVGNQDLMIWLRTMTHPDLDTRFHTCRHNGKTLVLLVVPRAISGLTRFKSQAYIRVGSSKKYLADVPALEKKLWQLINQGDFEDGLALRNLDASRVLSLLDYPTLFELVGKGLPENKAAIIETLEQLDFINKERPGSFSITNLGAIVIAKNLDEFPGLSRKTLRIIVYKGLNRTETIKEYESRKGYANGFLGAIEYINNLLPMNEIIGRAFRQEVRLFPEIAIRELLANTLIHQDFSIRGSGPMVEIFSDRIELTNPGLPLIDPKRFLDHSPRSRNERVARFFRLANICEERGSGIDKVFTAVESFQLPPPDIQIMTDATRIVLFGVREHAEMSPNERVLACYWHAVLLYESGRKRMSNATLRDRLGIGKVNYPMASKVIADTIKAGLIKFADPDMPKSGYVPFWS